MREELADIERYLIGDIWASGEMWANLESLCGLWPHRSAGSSYEREAAAFLSGRLKAYDMSDVFLEEFPFNCWRRGEPASLDVITPFPQRFACLAIPYSAPGLIEGEVVDVAMGTPEDFARVGDAARGKVCLFEMRSPSYRPAVGMKEKTLMAVQAGAIAAVWRGQYEGYLLPTGWAAVNAASPIPTVGLTSEDGAALARLIHEGTVRIRLSVDCETAPGTSQNVVADLKGASDPDSVLVLGAHYDGHDISPAAADNGFGTAVVLEVARVLARQRHYLRRTIRFVLFGAEEMGLLGSFAHVRKHASELYSTMAMINVDDMPGNGLKNGFAIQGYPELVPYFRQMSESMAWHFEVDVRYKTASDHLPFAMEGVPAISLDWLNHTPTWGLTHTPADTIEKVSYLNMRLIAVQVARVLLRLANEDAWPVSRQGRDEMLAGFDASAREAALELEGKSNVE